VGPSGVLGRQPIERHHQVVQHRGIGIFLNRQRRRGVTDKQRYRAFAGTGVAEEFCDLSGKVGKAGP